jgi:hypothetical protein
MQGMYQAADLVTKYTSIKKKPKLQMFSWNYYLNL